MCLTRMKSRIALAMAVACVGMLSACGGGGGTADYDFNGTWTFASTIVESTVPGFPVGAVGSDVVRITQTGTAVNVIIWDVPPMVGVCDPVAGTLSATGTKADVVVTITATAVDEDTMTGEVTLTSGPTVVRFQGSLQLGTRDRATAGPTSSGLVGGTVSGTRR